MFGFIAFFMMDFDGQSFSLGHLTNASYIHDLSIIILMFYKHKLAIAAVKIENTRGCPMSFSSKKND